MNNSEKNLISFYNAVGTLQSVKTETTGQFSVINQPNGFWPQLIYNSQFDKNPEESFRKLMEKLTHSNSKLAAICYKEEFGKLNQEKLREASVFPVETWTTMEISDRSVVKESDKIEFEYRQLTHLSDFSEFTELVNTGMMKTIKIAEGFFAELAQNPEFEFYGLFAENELVSGLITFTKCNITGLYFIVTKEGFRGKGLAEFFIGKTLKRLFEKGTESVVLQAVNKAVSLYSRLGFTADEKLVILMKY